ncbi:MAG: hypothetical protein V4584_06620 [Verrucomicrobiota bacterium]
MKFPLSFQWSRSAARVCVAVVCLFPSLLLAHPGHYHPDETDEFDFLRATFLHSHGAMDYLLAVTAIGCIALACLHGKTSVRITAMAAALGSLALLPIL